MNRRQFVKNSLVILGGFPVGARGLAQVAGVEKGTTRFASRHLEIEYIRKTAPAFEIPRYRGQRYQDTVPDTLDIAERAKLGVNVLTRVTDAAAGGEIYIGASFERNPVVMTHDFADWCQLVEGMMEGLPLLRLACGSNLNEHVDAEWMIALTECLGPDGLVYIPMEGRPWSRSGLSPLDTVWRADGTTTKTTSRSVVQLTAPCMWARALGTMTLYYLRDQNPLWKTASERMVRRMTELAVIEGDRAFIPFGFFEPNARLNATAARQARPTRGRGMDIGVGRLAQGLAQCYRMTACEAAAELAGKIVNYVRHGAGYYDESGRFLPDPGDIDPKYMWEYAYRAHANEGPVRNIEDLSRLLAGQRFGGHFHTHTIGLLSVLEYAIAVRDRETMEWVRSGFEWAKTQGSSLVGFFPEQILPYYPRCETCEVADMIALAVKLTNAGAGDYWDDVDRWLRNQFTENQLTSVEWVYEGAERLSRQPIPPFSTANRVPERNLGAFTPIATANQWGGGTWHCCTGNGVRTIYYVWEHALQHQDGRLRANLMINRASPWADVHSFIPHRGRVEVKMKRPCSSVLVRAPEWITANDPQVQCRVNDAPRAVVWEGRYLNLGPGMPGETFSLLFPIATRRAKETLGGLPYSLEIKGNTVISIDPPGKYGPLYNRAAARAERVPWRKVERFVPEESINW